MERDDRDTVAQPSTTPHARQPTPDRAPPPHGASPPHATSAPLQPRRRWMWLLLVVVLVVGARMVYGARRGTDAPGSAGGAPGPNAPVRAVPVVGVAARQGEMPVYLTGLGSVTAYNTVTLKSRVEGQLVSVGFREGQLVHEGDVIAEVDPRPFQVQLTQAEGQMARDLAQLQDAKASLERFRTLLADGVIAKQDYDDKVAAVGQFEGATKLDQGLIDNAKLQLTYSRITAPITGRAGLRLIDVGNIVQPNDATGLVVITQIQPIAVNFTIPEDDLPAVLAKLRQTEHLPVEAYDRAGNTQIATGWLHAIDNQIDRTTGTTRLKGVFANDDGALYPNQFVNVHLLLDVHKEAVLVPTAAVQRGPHGTFVYAVKPDRTVEVRPVTLGPQSETDTAIERGVAVGETVVVDGIDKLRAGMTVDVSPPRATGATAAADGHAPGGAPADRRQPAAAPTAPPA